MGMGPPGAGIGGFCATFCGSPATADARHLQAVSTFPTKAPGVMTSTILTLIFLGTHLVVRPASCGAFALHMRAFSSGSPGWSLGPGLCGVPDGCGEHWPGNWNPHAQCCRGPGTRRVVGSIDKQEPLKGRIIYGRRQAISGFRKTKLINCTLAVLLPRPMGPSLPTPICPLPTGCQRAGAGTGAGSSEPQVLPCPASPHVPLPQQPTTPAERQEVVETSACHAGLRLLFQARTQAGRRRSDSSG